MDNFKPKNRHNQHRSLDGFVGPQPKRAQPIGPIARRTQNQNFMPSRLEQPRLDNFKMPDGFSPSQSPTLPTPNALHKPTEISFHSGHSFSLGDMSTAKELGDMHAVPAEASGKHGHKRLPLRRREDAVRKSLKRHKKRHWGKIILRSSLALTILVVLTVGFIFGKGYLKLHNVLKGGGSGAVALGKDVNPFQLRGEGDGRVNILMLGIGGPGHDGPDLTDTILIASIDPVQKEASLLSIPRDLYVKNPSGGSSKINAVYPNAKYAILNRASSKTKTAELNTQATKAGIDAIEKTVTQVVGIPIHYYLMVDFEAFRQAIDTVGGVDIDVKEQLYDPTVAWENNWNPVIAKVGVNHMGGKQALLYSRSRHGSARGDFDRTERQREILLALKSKILTAGTFANPLKLSGLIDAFGNHVSTDLGLNDVTRLYDIGKDIDSSKVGSLGLADPPNNFVTTDNIDNISIVRPTKGLNEYADIQNYVRNALRDSFLKSENATVAVLNGTTASGLATTKATELKSFGYTVGTVGTAPTADYTKTVIIDMTKGTKKYTKNYLEKRFGVAATTTLPDPSIDTTNADFVIILGSDAAIKS